MLKVTLDRQQLLVQPGERLVIGRARSSHLRARGGRCAPIHVIIEQRGDRWFAIDADTEFGSFCDGKRFEMIALADHTELRLGSPAGVKVQIREYYSAPEPFAAQPDVIATQHSMRPLPEVDPVAG